jgi:hypothetical protein
VGEEENKINLFPPSTASRPKLTFKEFEVNHLVETIAIPGRPQWNPITLTLYDIDLVKNHPIYEWLLTLYGTPPGLGRTGGFAGESEQFPYRFSGNANNTSSSRFKKPRAYVQMFDGCGCMLEQWTLENVWPQDCDFGELDMGNSEVATITVTLRYDRAFLEVFGQGIYSGASAGVQATSVRVPNV